MNLIDLRSDTVTKPTPAMRRAMAEAEVGDDVYGEDPTVNRLEARCAALFGKEAALFVASGSMANQLAVCLHTRPGEEVVLAPESHVVKYESGGFAANAGVQPFFVGEGGVFDGDDVQHALRPRTDYSPRTRLVWFENTHNAAGGRVWPLDKLRSASHRAATLGLSRHLDGARIFNAVAHSGVEPQVWGGLVDTLGFCFSKGLGAPVGSMLVGSRAHIAEARWLRRRFGGAMRQVGILAAAADYALTHNRARLATDHAHAQALAVALANMKHARIDPTRVETNLVHFDVADSVPDGADVVVRALADLGVLVSATSHRRIRAVTHLDFPAQELPRAIEAFAAVLD